jgi:hypothetical protein
MSQNESQQVTHLKDAQRQTYRARLLYDRVRHGLRDHNEETVRREWQTALLGYHSEIQRYKYTRNLEDVWYEPIPSPVEISLEQLGEVVFQDETISDETIDRTTMRTKTVERTEPMLFTAEQLRQIQIKLDECYHELGFDEPPKTVQQHTGTIGDEAEEVLEGLDEEDIEEVIDEIERLVEEKRDKSESADPQVPEGTPSTGT